MANNRLDHSKGFRQEYERNRKKILATQEVCGICGLPVDKSLKCPHPLAPTVDHIRPLNKGGHPSALDNLQLAHFRCNRLKSDNWQAELPEGKTETDLKADPEDPRNLPLSLDWERYTEKNQNTLKEEAQTLQAKGVVCMGYCRRNNIFNKMLI